MFHSSCLSVMPDHILEDILALISLTSLVVGTYVCKKWRSIISCPTFLDLYSQIQEHSESFLCVNGFRYKITDANADNNGSRGEDPAEPVVSTIWRHYWGTGWLIFDLSEQSALQKLSYKLGILDKQWKETPALIYSRVLPIVGMLKRLRNCSHMVICIGGLISNTIKESISKVQIFDSESNAWEECEDLLVEFHGISTAKAISTLVCNQKLFIFHIYSGIMGSFDGRTKCWSQVKTFRPPGMQYNYLALRMGRL